MTRRRTLIALMLLLAALVAGSALLALWMLGSGRSVPPGTVFLTFDTEQEPDREALDRLNVSVPATFFLTGDYAKAHPDLVRRLASAGHTIGAHSFFHDDLTTLNDRQRALDLRMSKVVIEEIACVPVRWFRAPYLAVDDSTLQQIIEAGYLFNSSDRANWPKIGGPPSIAVSAHEGRLASDFDIFESGALEDEAALSFLVEAYERHRAEGRPFVVLLHPRIIGAHLEVLQRFIAHVEENGGSFATLDDFVESLTVGGVERPRLGLWVDLDEPVADVSRLADQAASLGVTDVFLSAVGSDGTSYVELLVGDISVFDAVRAALQKEGIRVHAWLPVTANPLLARERPDLAMKDALGRASELWVSPSHPDVRAGVFRLAQDLVRDHSVDGLMFDQIRYPDWNHDFSAASMERFAVATGITEADPEVILSSHYNAWTLWRVAEIADLLAEVEAAVRPLAQEGFEFGAALDARAAVDYRALEAAGQDYTTLGGYLDLVVLAMAPPEVGAARASWPYVLFAARSKLGSADVLAGLDLTRAEGSDGASILDRELKLAIALSEGAVLPLSPALFGTGEDEDRAAPAEREVVEDRFGPLFLPRMLLFRRSAILWGPTPTSRPCREAD